MAESVRVHLASIDTAPVTELCIRSMREHAGHPFELTVGDGGSTDGSLEMLRSFERRGWLSVEVERQPNHYEWLDRWLGRCDEEFAIFVDSDVEFLRDGWLRDLVRTAALERAALVCGELCPEYPFLVEPVNGRTIRVAARPAPWLLLVRARPIAALGVSFAFREFEDESVPEGVLAYDVGGWLFRHARERGLRWVAMPADYHQKYRHYAGMSWRAFARRHGLDSAAKADDQSAKLDEIEPKLEVLRRSQEVGADARSR